MTTNKTARWYLIQTKPRQEARAEEHLLRQHFECYRPLKASAATRSGQGAKAGEPLFPGYLFIRLDSTHDNWYPIRSTRGVNRVVSFGGQPTPVRDELIEQLRQRLAQVSGGSFSEIEAIFVSSDGEERSVILLNLLQREQKVRVPTRYLQCHS